jgi:hypothetical protein
VAGSLKGSPQLLARLKALKLAFKPMGRDWATDTARSAERSAPRRSVRVKSATQRRAVVNAIWYAKFVNRGTAPHTIKPKRGGFLIFNAGGRTIFARSVNHRGNRGTRFVDKAAHAALARHVDKDALIDAWNRAA